MVRLWAAMFLLAGGGLARADVARQTGVGVARLFEATVGGSPEPVAGGSYISVV